MTEGTMVVISIKEIFHQEEKSTVKQSKSDSFFYLEPLLHKVVSSQLASKVGFYLVLFDKDKRTLFFSTLEV